MTEDADNFSLDMEPDREPGGGLDPPTLKVYLASALTKVDGQSLAEAERARVVICETFRGYDHRGVRFDVYDPGEVTAPGSSHSAEEVYATDHIQTSQADLVVFLVCNPSLGVGMEAQIAADCTLPRVVISKRDSPVSRMFSGVFSPTIALIEYNTTDELRTLLLERRLEIAEAALVSARTRRRHLAHLCQDALGAKIMRMRILKGMSLKQLAKATDIRIEWLQRIEREPILAASMTIIEMHRISTALQMKAAISSSGVPTLVTEEGESQLSDNERRSLENLVSFARDRDEPPKDDIVLDFWKSYCDEQEALRHRGESGETVTADEWNRRYDRQGRRLF